MEIKIIMNESELKILKNALKSYEGKTSEKKVIQDLLGLIEWQEQHQNEIKRGKQNDFRFYNCNLCIFSCWFQPCCIYKLYY